MRLWPTNTAWTAIRLATPPTHKEKQAKKQMYAEIVKNQQQQRGKTEHESGVKELTLKK